MKKSSIICIITGFVLLAIGMAFLLALPLILLKLIDSKIILDPNNQIFEIWRDLPIPIDQSFYFFNVTNAEEVKSSGAVPQLQQIGPFVFNLDVKKFDINFTDCGERVSFRENIGYFFDREKSVHDLSLKLTTINAPLAIALDLIKDLHPDFVKYLSILFLDYLKEDIFIERTVGQLLFDGYPDILIKLSSTFNPKMPFQSKFGYFYNKNETNDGLFVVNTGKTDINLLNSIEELNGSPDLNFWSSPRCNSLLGSKNGEIYNPIKSNDETLKFFRTDLCRVWTLVWKSSFKSTIGGLQVYRYFPAETTFANSTDYPPNSCYKPMKRNDNKNIDLNLFLKTVKSLLGNDSTLLQIMENGLMNFNETEFDRNSKKVDKLQEYPSGVFDMSLCHFGAPIYLSFPHFLGADPYYLSNIKGLSPNSTLHQTYLDLEPLTGTPIELKLRLQINVRIDEMANSFSRYKNVPKIHFPVLWQEFSVRMTDKIANDLHWTLTWPSIIATIISSLFVAVGALTLLCVASKPLLRRVSNRWRNENHINESERSPPFDDNIQSDDDHQQLIN